MNIQVLYEDDHILALNKPAHMLVHADGRSNEETLVDWLEQTYPTLEGVGETERLVSGEIVVRSGIVHRLDKDTSGVILIPKNQECFLHLKKQFQDRTIKKIYKAFVYDNIKEDKGVIERPIGRSPKDFRQWSAENNARGELREAKTEWEKVISTKKVAFLTIFPHTGRTHQIRVHLKYIEHPIVADPLYAPNRDKLLHFERLALHSHTITFKDCGGKEHTVEAPYPEDFVRAITEIESIANEETI